MSEPSCQIPWTSTYQKTLRCEPTPDTWEPAAEKLTLVISARAAALTSTSRVVDPEIVPLYAHSVPAVSTVMPMAELLTRNPVRVGEPPVTVTAEVVPPVEVRSVTVADEERRYRPVAASSIQQPDTSPVPWLRYMPFAVLSWTSTLLMSAGVMYAYTPLEEQFPTLPPVRVEPEKTRLR